MTYQPPVKWEYKYGASFMSPQCMCVSGGPGGGGGLVLTLPGCPNVKDMGPFLSSRE